MRSRHCQSRARSRRPELDVRQPENLLLEAQTINQEVTQSLRVYNPVDVVTHIPSAVQGYFHVAGGFHIDAKHTSHASLRPKSREGYWIGYWPGEKARATTPLQHVKQIRPTQCCWCGLDRQYGQCHRSQDIARLTPKLQKRYQR